MGAHQGGPPGIVERAAHRDADGRQWITFGRDQVEVVALPYAGDAGLHPAPEKYALVRGLPPAARVERRGVKDDALGIAGQNHSIPFAQGLIVEFQPVRAPLSLTHPGSLLPGLTASGTCTSRRRPSIAGSGRSAPG